MIDALPDAPDPATDLPADFNKKAAAWVLAQKAMVPQINAALGSMATLAAGGAFALLYAVDLTTTADGDPGTGKLRFDNANQNAATTLRLDTVVGGADVTTLLDQFDASSSVVKGSIRLQKLTDPSKWLMFNVTARAAPTGYRNISVTLIGASSTNPFGNTDGVLLYFQRTGDMGPTGISAVPCVHVREEQATNTAGSAGTSVTTGVYRRVLNTTKQNDVGATLSGNMLTLPAGKWLLRAKASIDVSVSAYSTVTHKTVIFNQTDGAVAGAGTNAQICGMGSGSNVVVQLPTSEAIAIVTLTASKTFWVGTYTGASVNSWGQAANLANAEVYTEFIAEKIG